MASYYKCKTEKYVEDESEDLFTQKMIEEIWEQHDKDKNGLIDFAEMSAFIKDFLTRLGMMPDKELNYQNIFETLDTD